MFRNIDVDGSGVADLQNFADTLNSKSKFAKRAFMVMDEDGSGNRLWRIRFVSGTFAHSIRAL